MIPLYKRQNIILLTILFLNFWYSLLLEFNKSQYFIIKTHNFKVFEYLILCVFYFV